MFTKNTFKVQFTRECLRPQRKLPLKIIYKKIVKPKSSEFSSTTWIVCNAQTEHGRILPT